MIQHKTHAEKEEITLQKKNCAGAMNKTPLSKNFSVSNFAFGNLTMHFPHSPFPHPIPQVCVAGTPAKQRPTCLDLNEK